MNQTLSQQAYSHDNNYSHLEALYHRATGGELVRDPYRSVDHPLRELTLTASVIVPAHNEKAVIEQCLISIEQSTFNRKYPAQLEVIAVDDGSTDGTWQLLEGLQLNLHLKAARQEHHGLAHARNVGIAMAEGDVIICCDADFILTPFAIEEMVKRHQVLDHVMVLGFYWGIDVADPRIRPDVLRENLPHLLVPFAAEGRMNYLVGGWPENPCRDSEHLKLLGQNDYLVMADGSRWDMHSMIHGGLSSLQRRDFIAMDGYDERFRGWGLEDTLAGMYAMALGNYIVPVYSATGWHIDRGNRNPNKWQDFARNKQVFDEVLRSPFVPNQERWLAHARSRIHQHFERAPSANSPYPGNISDFYAVFDDELTDPVRYGKYLFNLGRYDEAAEVYATVPGLPERQPWAVFDRGKALRAGGHAEQAVPLFEAAAGYMPDTPWPLIELSLALAALDRFAEARERLEQARLLDPTNGWIHFILDRSPHAHKTRAEHYMRQGNYALAVQDYEAALILAPHDNDIQTGRARALTGLEECILSVPYSSSN